MTTTLSFHKGQSVGRNPIPSVTIEFHEEFPDTSGLGASRAIHNKDAANLADILQDTLPGGTFHALLVELLKRKTNLLVIPDVKG